VNCQAHRRKVGGLLFHCRAWAGVWVFKGGVALKVCDFHATTLTRDNGYEMMNP
jgi:hypothetical protein